MITERPDRQQEAEKASPPGTQKDFRHAGASPPERVPLLQKHLRPTDRRLAKGTPSSPHPPWTGAESESRITAAMWKRRAKWAS